jgi:Gpi18-like mannosyltransferase
VPEAAPRTIPDLPANEGDIDPISPIRARIPALFLALLDLVIVVYASGLALIAFAGGADLGILSFRQAEKPILALLMLIPVRVACGGRSWLPTLLRATADRLQGAWTSARARVPPAVLDTCLIVAAERIASVAVAFLANVTFEPAITHGFSMPFDNPKFMEIFAAWDSGWYWDIASHGYYFRTDGPSSIAFFPLYPILMRIAAAPFGGGPGATWIAGIVVAFLAYASALVTLHRLAFRLLGSREAARRTIVYVVVFPWSFFFTRVYSESVFLLTSVLAVTAAYDRRWWRAGVWGALATLTRPNGILIALPLALLAILDRPGLRSLAARTMALALIPLAFTGFCAYAYTLSGDPLGWMSAQAHWTYSLGHPPWQQLQRVIGTVVDQGLYDYFVGAELAPIELLQAGTAVLFVMIIPMIFRRLGAAMGMYVLVSLLVPLSSNTLEGLGRYASVLFPAFILVASVTTDKAHEALIVVSLAFRTLLLSFFVTWQPIY